MARRHRVDERPVLVVAGIAGVVGALSDASPTGTTAIDAVLTFSAIAFVVWCAASAPWWVLAVAATASMAMAGSLWLLAIGAVAFAGALWIGLQKRDLPVERAVTAAIAFNVLVRAEVDPVLGFSALVGVGCGLLVVVLGVRRRGPRAIRWVSVAGIAIGAVAVVAVAGAGFAVGAATSDLRAGNVSGRDAVSLLSDGDYQGATGSFAEAATQFESASSTLDAPWARPAMLIPVVAQNRAAAADLSKAAAEASSAIAEASSLIDVDQLTLRNGRFDIDAITLLSGPLGDVSAAIDSLSDTIADVDSPWLAGPLSERLDDLDDDLAEYRPQLANATQAIERVPGLLGADGPRRYFIAFTTPAETRGLGGFMGNWIELTADDGRIRVSASGRTRDLNLAGDDARVVTGPEDWLGMWGQYGFDNGPGGTTGAVPWSNITVSPQFPSTGQVIAELYPQSGGRSIDGVFAADPFAMAGLLGFTGPIRIDGVDGALTKDNVVRFLLIDQYETENDERIDLLEEVATQTIGLLLTGSLPGPVQVADTLGPLVDEGRIVGWAADPDEQQYFADIGLTGSMPTIGTSNGSDDNDDNDGSSASDDTAGSDSTTASGSITGSDGIAVVLNNAGANKLDVYLERELGYDATVDAATGETTATATVTLTNTAPSSGLPDGVLGNYTGDEPGTNRVLVSLYSALPVESATVERPDGSTADVQVAIGEEAGWLTGTTFLVVPSGESVTLTYRLAGPLPLDDGYSLAVRPQPMVIDEQLRVAVVDTDGSPLVSFEGPSVQPRVLGD